MACSPLRCIIHQAVAAAGHLNLPMLLLMMEETACQATGIECILCTNPDYQTNPRPHIACRWDRAQVPWEISLRINRHLYLEELFNHLHLDISTATSSIIVLEQTMDIDDHWMTSKNQGTLDRVQARLLDPIQRTPIYPTTLVTLLFINILLILHSIIPDKEWLLIEDIHTISFRYQVNLRKDQEEDLKKLNVYTTVVILAVISRMVRSII
jgi:hypothetical protein